MDALPDGDEPVPRAAPRTTLTGGGATHRRRIFGGLLIALLAVSTAASAQTAGSDALKAAPLWVLVAACPVFWMNAGVACPEAGLCRAKMRDARAGAV